MKYRFQTVNARNSRFRCNAREGKATSFAGNRKRATAGFLRGWGAAEDRAANVLRLWLLKKSSRQNPPQIDFMAKVSAKLADTLLWENGGWRP
jgi:hypothetical protein